MEIKKLENGKMSLVVSPEEFTLINGAVVTMFNGMADIKTKTAYKNIMDDMQIHYMLTIIVAKCDNRKFGLSALTFPHTPSCYVKNGEVWVTDITEHRDEKLSNYPRENQFMILQTIWLEMTKLQLF